MGNSGRRVWAAGNLAGLLILASALVWLGGVAWAEQHLTPPASTTSALILTVGMTLAAAAGYVVGLLARDDDG